MTMKLIETKTLASAAASIEFTEIPQDGTDLLVLHSIRTNNSQNAFFIEFNSVSTGYSRRNLVANGSGVFTYAGSDGEAGQGGASNYTANSFGNGSIYIPNYAGATNKSWSTDSVGENNATASAQMLVGGLWSNTAAITSLKITVFGGNSFVSDSTVSLYKITKGSDGIVTTS